MAYDMGNVISKLVVEEDNYNERIFIEEVLVALSSISYQLDKILVKLLQK